jgi:hypothetical protein
VEKINDKQLSAGDKLENWLIRFGVDAHPKKNGPHTESTTLSKNRKLAVRLLIGIGLAIGSGVKKDSARIRGVQNEIAPPGEVHAHARP